MDGGVARQRRVGSFKDRAQTELARSFLASHDIDARLAIDDGGGTRPELTVLTGGGALFVDEADAELAERLLRDSQAAHTPTSETSSLRLRRNVLRVFALLLLLPVAWVLVTDVLSTWPW